MRAIVEDHGKIVNACKLSFDFIFPRKSYNPRMDANTSKDTAAESNPPPRSLELTKPDLLTLAAIAIAATVITNFLHEGLGHGGMCIATGGRPLVLSTVHFACSAEPRLVAAGGTLANLIFGASFG